MILILLTYLSKRFGGHLNSNLPDLYLQRKNTSRQLQPIPVRANQPRQKSRQRGY